jgi:asparagine synthase (glutamine-hydrolysing)
MEFLLAESVRIRMIADVPLGALLSGGTDSSTVVALMARSSSRPIKTFSIGFRDAAFNEVPFARAVAQTFGTQHHELILEPDILETVEKLTTSLEEPFGDSSMLPTYYVCCLAREQVTVALSGDGGDEAFAGYDRYRIHLQDRAADWISPWAGRLYRKHIHPLVPYQIPGKSLAYSMTLPWHDRYLEAVSIVPFQREMNLLSDEFMSAGDPLQIFRGYLSKAPARDPLSRLLYLDTKTYLAGDILTKVDRMSMLTSLEARVPILDHIFLEWVTRLSTEWKSRNGTAKYILRKLAEKLGVPRDVLYRPKQGFALPLVHWVRHELRDLILGVLLEPRTLQRGYFNASGVRNLLDEHFRGRRNHAGLIWRLLMFELWNRNFLESFATRDWAQQPIPAFQPKGIA